MSHPRSHCLFITQYYKPEPIGSAPFCADVAEWLTDHGVPTTVLTSMPHYPHGQVFPSYGRRGPVREVMDGVSVERIPAHWASGESAIRRMGGEIEFFLRGIWALLSRPILPRCLVLSLCPSILCVALGILASLRCGCHVAVVHDIQSGLAGGLGLVRRGFILRCLRWCERTLLNHVDLVVVLSEQMRQQLLEIGVETCVEIVPIWVDTDDIRPLPANERGAPKVLYSGNFGRKQGLSQILSLAEELRARRPEIEITLRGAGSQTNVLAEEVASRGLTNIRFAELAPREKLNEALAAGDIHLVPQDPLTADSAVPSKAFSIMAAGRPFVTTVRPGSDLWHLQGACGGFLCVPPNDLESLTGAVLKLADDARYRQALGMRGRRYVEQHFSKHNVLSEFTEMLRASYER